VYSVNALHTDLYQLNMMQTYVNKGLQDKKSRFRYVLSGASFWQWSCGICRAGKEARRMLDESWKGSLNSI